MRKNDGATNRPKMQNALKKSARSFLSHRKGRVILTLLTFCISTLAARGGGNERRQIEINTAQIFQTNLHGKSHDVRLAKACLISGFGNFFQERRFESELSNDGLRVHGGANES